MPRNEKLVPIGSRKQFIKYAVGSGLFIIGVIMWAMYFKNPELMIYGSVGAAFILPGAGVIIWAWKSRSAELHFAVKKPKGLPAKAKVAPNAVVICARRPKGYDHDVPVAMKFVHLNHIPVNARLHYFRNFSKHFYEIYNDTSVKGLAAWKPVVIQDKSPFSPRTFNIYSTMQSFKEALEYVPINTLEKFAPWALIAAIFIIGIMMVMTVTG